ncbi:GNAT family N-acetyltransferase [Marinomonas spartinae]|uniref:GNAT family N-acetyltransferase n=1 Tax=Marinomonas spartinae TaxID=1792290 RepID=UPI0018F16AAC|nr:GNAT family N-acetyltransferase [Marinomonas spartinae]MBJ7553557.1 GNAT family N-acetyltransferase [Marinomonas spartinae]
MASLFSHFFSRHLPRIARRSVRQVSQPVMYSERLILRPFLLSDADVVTYLVNTSLVADMTASIPHPYPEGLSARWIESHLEGWQARRFICFAVELKQTRQLIGSISLMNIHDDQAELGYWYGVDFWRQGFATEAAKRLVCGACSDFGLKRLTARHLDRNPASGNVLKKVGFAYQSSEMQQLGLMTCEELMHLYVYQPPFLVT